MDMPIVGMAIARYTPFGEMARAVGGPPPATEGSEKEPFLVHVDREMEMTSFVREVTKN